MFSGIVKELGRVIKIERLDGVTKLDIEAPISLSGASIDDSISINGVCLTIVNLKEGLASFDVLPETIRRTNLNDLEIGACINVESSLALQDKLGGHILQGHVDCKIRIESIENDGGAKEIFFMGETEYMEMLVKKAYIALDGISLTITDIFKNGFKVMIIPHTLNNTIVKNWKVGSYVNMEVDILNKSIYQYMKLFNEKQVNMDRSSKK